jgi:hypothetical protein
MVAWVRVAAAAGGLLVVGVVTAPSASAELNGPCEATGTIEETGLTIDPSTSDGPFEVPLSGTVVWSGSIGDGTETEERATGGAIAVVGPPLFDAVLGSVLEFREWGDPDAVSTAESDTDGYDLPDYTPRDTELVVTGFHDDELGNCDGEITVIVEGDPLDSPIAVASLAGTVITGAGVALAALARGST